MKKMMLTALAATFATLALTACHTPKQLAPVQSVQSTQTFSCEVGDVTITRVDDERISLSFDGKSEVLSLAPAASGEFYKTDVGFFGHGATWHQKGDKDVIFEVKNEKNMPITSVCEKAN